jgi:hypothetical protein
VFEQAIRKTCVATYEDDLEKLKKAFESDVVMSRRLDATSRVLRLGNKIANVMVLTGFFDKARKSQNFFVVHQVRFCMGSVFFESGRVSSEMSVPAWASRVRRSLSRNKRDRCQDILYFDTLQSP